MVDKTDKMIYTQREFKERSEKMNLNSSNILKLLSEENRFVFSLSN